MTMYDTVFLTLPADRANVGNLCDYAGRLTDVSEHKFKNGTVIFSGNLENLNVHVSERCLKIKGGSICKLFHGNNYERMTLNDTKTVFDNLSDALGLPMSAAIVTRLDFGCTLPVDEPPDNYYNHLGSYKRAKRLEQPNGLNYQYNRGCQWLKFYDKHKEQRHNGGRIPESFKDTYALRYEMVFLGRLSAIFRRDAITTECLYDRGFYNELIKRWAEAYKTINKLNNMDNNIANLNCATNSEWHRMKQLAVVQALGGEQQALKFIDEMRKKGEINSVTACRRRKEIREACKPQEGIIEQCTAISELNSKIVDVANQMAV